MLVHSRLCGTLIGKGGATIRSFNEDSRAVFNISPPPTMPGGHGTALSAGAVRPCLGQAAYVARLLWWRGCMELCSCLMFCAGQWLLWSSPGAVSGGVCSHLASLPTTWIRCSPVALMPTIAEHLSAVSFVCRPDGTHREDHGRRGRAHASGGAGGHQAQVPPLGGPLPAAWLPLQKLGAGGPGGSERAGERRPRGGLPSSWRRSATSSAKWQRDALRALAGPLLAVRTPTTTC